MNKMKETKGITLIALVITIIVLLILAGITIALITGQNSAPQKAVEARTENEAGAAKDAATMLVAEKVQGYYEDKYVKSPAATSASNQLAYIAEKLGSGVTTGDYTVTVTAAGAITVTKAGEELATGTVSEEGVISWGGSSSGGQTAGGPTIVGDAPVVGESVNYNPGSLTTASVDLPEGAEIEKTKVASVDLSSLSGTSITSNATANQAANWQILDYDENTGEVLIVPTSGTLATLKLEGMNGYNNAIQALDAVTQIYVNPTYAKSARSIKVEDIYKISDLDPTSFATYPDGQTQKWNHRYSMDTNLNIVDNGEGNEDVERTYYDTPTTAGYTKAPSLVDGASSITNQSFWLASRCVNLDSGGGVGNCDFEVRCWYNDSVRRSNGLFSVNSDGGTNSNYDSYSVLPVVSLKSGVTMTKTNGVWALN